MKLQIRNLAVIASVVFAIATPALQNAMNLGLSAGEFAGNGNSTLRAASYAFSIWGVIYAGLIAYAVRQALPRNRGDLALARIAWPSVVAIAGCGVWIIASSANWQWASVIIIITSAATLTLALIRHAPAHRDLRANLLAWWPLGMLAGWLTIASAINLLTVLTAQGLLAGEAAAMAGYAGVIAVLVIAIVVLRAATVAIYGLPIAWGLVAVWVAEQSPKPELAVVALVSAVIVGAYSGWRGRPGADLG